MTRQPHDGEPGSRVPGASEPSGAPGTRGNRKLVALANLQDLLDDPDGIDRFVDAINEGIRRAGFDVPDDGDDETPLEEFEERT